MWFSTFRILDKVLFTCWLLKAHPVDRDVVESFPEGLSITACNDKACMCDEDKYSITKTVAGKCNKN